MALSAARIPDSTVGVNKCVAILTGAERQLQYSETSVNLKNGIASERTTQRSEISSTRAGDDLLDAFRGVGDAVRRLRKESLVIVIVSVQHEIDAAVI